VSAFPILSIFCLILSGFRILCRVETGVVWLYDVFGVK
jgi:hypothetical protein